MRVLHLGKFYPPHRGGMESHLEILANSLAPHVDLHVVVASDSRSTSVEDAGGFRLTRAGTLLQTAATPICPSLFRLVRESRADLIHVHHPHPFAMLAHLAAAPDVPLVVTYHTDIVRQRVLGRAIHPLLSASLSRASAILVTSPLYLESSAVLRGWRDKCRVVPLGIPLDHVKTGAPEKIADIRRRFPGPIVLAVGRLVYYKGFEYLIRAMRQIDATLLIIGTGPKERELATIASHAGVRNRVMFLGEVPDVTPYYHSADVFVLPSTARSEAFGVVQLEAMAAGVAVVNTAIATGVTFVSRHNQTGLTVPPADADALARAINTLLGDPMLRVRLGRAGRARVQEAFSAEAMARATLGVYEEVLNRRSAVRRMSPLVESRPA